MKDTIIVLSVIVAANVAATIYLVSAREAAPLSHTSLLVSVMGLLLTVAVAWQIYSAISLRNIDTKFERLRRQNHNDIAAVKARITGQQAINFDVQAANDLALIMFVQSLDVYNTEVSDKRGMQSYLRDMTGSLLEFMHRVVPESISYESHVRDELLAKAVLLKQAGIIDAVDYIFRTQVINPPTP